MAKDTVNQSDYKDSNIVVLEGLDPVRKRPGMYIGGTDKTALHHTLWEVVDNSADEALGGYGDLIVIRRHEDGTTMSVRDYGRGIPVGVNETTGLSTVETVMTVLHAGGKFDSDSYKVSGGLHGVGLSVVTALSSSITAVVYRDTKKHELKIVDGGAKIIQPLKVVGENSLETGTEITFTPDPTIFKETVKFDSELIKKRLQRSSFLNPKLRYRYEYFEQNEESGELELQVCSFYSENGIVDYIEHVFAKSGTTQLIDTFSVEKDGEYENEEKIKESVKVKFAFTYAKESKTNVLAFVNNIPTTAGPHYNSMMNAVKTAIANKAKEKKLDKKIKKFTASDLEEGLTAIIAVYAGEVHFSGQTKEKLAANKAISSATYSTIKGSLETYLEENPATLKKIISKIELAKRAREASDRSREAVRKSDMDNMAGILPTKLADCRSKKPEECELYLVEGDSAGGGAKESRNGRTQAILPLKGKVLNALRKSKLEVFKNTEVGALITAIGAGGVMSKFEPEKARYNKIIIFTDADVDGGHIGFLLVLFFMKYMRPLIDAGYLYIVVPPLYRYSKGSDYEYFFNEKERNKFFSDLWINSGKGALPYITGEHQDDSDADENSSLDLDKLTKGWTGTRFKGLGEMNPEQLEEAALNPETRVLKKLVIPKVADSSNEQSLTSPKTDEDLDLTKLVDEFSIDDVLNILGGDESSIRKWFLMKYTSEIDVDI